jgi:hypothetical protein
MRWLENKHYDLPDVAALRRLDDGFVVTAWASASGGVSFSRVRFMPNGDIQDDEDLFVLSVADLAELTARALRPVVVCPNSISLMPVHLAQQDLALQLLKP